MGWLLGWIAKLVIGGLAALFGIKLVSDLAGNITVIWGNNKRTVSRSEFDAAAQQLSSEERARLRSMILPIKASDLLDDTKDKLNKNQSEAIEEELNHILNAELDGGPPDNDDELAKRKLCKKLRPLIDSTLGKAQKIAKELAFAHQGASPGLEKVLIRLLALEDLANRYCPAPPGGQGIRLPVAA